MIVEWFAKAACAEDISKIENYEEYKNSGGTMTWNEFQKENL